MDTTDYNDWSQSAMVNNNMFSVPSVYSVIKVITTGTNHCNLLCPPFTPLALVFTNNKHLI